MSDDDLCLHFQDSLANHQTECVNKECDCLRVLSNAAIRRAVALYLVWFERKKKHEQDCIILDWYKYANLCKGWQNWYMLPINATDVDPEDPIRK